MENGINVKWCLALLISQIVWTLGPSKGQMGIRKAIDQWERWKFGLVLDSSPSKRICIGIT